MELPSKSKIGWAIVIVAIVAATLFFGVTYPLPTPPDNALSGLVTSRGLGINEFSEKSIRAENSLSSGGTLAVDGASTLTGNTAVGGTLGVTGATTLSSANVTGGLSSATMSTSAGLAVGTTFALAKQNNVTVTNGSTITVTNGYAGLTAAGAVGTSSIAGCTTQGRVTILENFGANTITITDTGTLMLGGNAALGQYDVLGLIGDGVNCLQLFKADN